MKNVVSYQRSELNPDGFTLVEMLVVISILGLLTAIGVAHMTRVGEHARYEAARQNAKIIVSTYQAAVAAGADESANGFGGMTTKRAILDALQAGVNGVGVFADDRFELSNLDAKTQSEAEAFLTYDTVLKVLVFNPDGVLP